MSKKIVRLKPNLAYIRLCLRNIEIDIDEIEIDMGGDRGTLFYFPEKLLVCKFHFFRNLFIRCFQEGKKMAP